MQRNPATGPQAPGPAAHAGAKPRPRRKTMTPRRPPDEAQRLAALAEFAAMDTPPEHDFDVLVKRLAQVCDVPIALICLVDADRAWFKARIGLEMHETPRDVSFAAHVILGDDIFEVPDAEADQRFAGNPFVTAEAGVRFYAGVPLRTPDGYKIGALGIGDRSPRRLSRAQREALRRIGREVMVQFERRRHLRASAVEQALETVDRGARAGEPDDLPIAGSRFGRYTVLDEIGRGAMATVYTAYDDQLDRRIAIKLIRDPGARVQREAQAAARISHPNVVQIYELGAYAGHDFIAMELVDGITLTTWQRIRSRSVYEIIAMYAQAGRGLAAAHRVGLVHRDFKPESVPESQVSENTSISRLHFGYVPTLYQAHEPVNTEQGENSRAHRRSTASAARRGARPRERATSKEHCPGAHKTRVMRVAGLLVFSKSGGYLAGIRGLRPFGRRGKTQREALARMVPSSLGCVTRVGADLS